MTAMVEQPTTDLTAASGQATAEDQAAERPDAEEATDADQPAVDDMAAADKAGPPSKVSRCHATLLNAPQGFVESSSQELAFTTCYISGHGFAFLLLCKRLLSFTLGLFVCTTFCCRSEQ